MKRQKSHNFSERVYAIVAKIPKGKTMTYGQVAAKAGKRGAARAVGTLMSKNYNPKIPCDRVVRSDGKVGGYAGKKDTAMVDIELYPKVYTPRHLIYLNKQITADVSVGAVQAVRALVARRCVGKANESEA